MNKAKGVGIGLRPKDYEQVQKAFANTTCHTLAEYCRKIILGKPIVVIYRDRSFDDFTEACIQLRKDLEVILAKGVFDESEKQWAHREIEMIKEKCIQIYKYVRESKNHQGPL